MAVYSKDYYEKNKEKIKARNKTWREANPTAMREYRNRWLQKTPGYVMLHNAKRRAKEDGVEFNLTLEDIHIPSHCPVLGFELDSETHERRPSLDRIIPQEGYVKGNVKVISVRANRLKSDASIEELRCLLHYLED